MKKIFKKLIAGVMVACVIATSMTIGAGAYDFALESDYWNIRVIPYAPSSAQAYKVDMTLPYYAGNHKAICDTISTNGTKMEIMVISKDITRWTLTSVPVFTFATNTTFKVNLLNANATTVGYTTVCDTNGNSYSSYGRIGY